MNIAVITGASSGLGKFYVEAVAKESYDEIWIIARRKEILEQMCDVIYDIERGKIKGERMLQSDGENK